MNSILYETDEQRKHVHTGWSKVVAVDEVYWKCNHCGVTADSPVAPADDPKVAEEGSSTNDRANAEPSRELAQEAQSEAPNVETLEEILIQVNCWCLHDRGCTIIEEQQKAIAKINRLMVKERLERGVYELERLQYNPHMFGDWEKVVEERIHLLENELVALSNNLSKGDGDEANGA